jgi:two-component system OmpR family sensor kinase
MRSIKPLKKLSKQVEKIRDGDMTISTKLIQTDEVGIVANTLDEALRRIEAMINTRQLFLRAIAHELNTPVAKGKLLTTFVKNREQQEEYHRVFERLEILIKEFFKIGQLFSSNYKIVARKYYISDLVEQAVELMLLSSEEMKNIHYIYEEETQIFTDFDLTALAIKNLIDNALKYSDNHEVTISIKKHGVTLCSKGKQCIKLLDPYREPFHKEKKSGFGLGLYIVHNISDMLSLKFTYVYQEGENCFLIYQEGFKK